MHKLIICLRECVTVIYCLSAIQNQYNKITYSELKLWHLGRNKILKKRIIT